MRRLTRTGIAAALTIAALAGAAGCGEGGGVEYLHAHRGDLPRVPRTMIVGSHDEAPVSPSLTHSYTRTLVILGPEGMSEAALERAQVERLLDDGWRPGRRRAPYARAFRSGDGALTASVAALGDVPRDGYEATVVPRTLLVARRSGLPGLVVNLRRTSG